MEKSKMKETAEAERIRDHGLTGKIFLMALLTRTYNLSPCSFGLSATSQYYFSLRTNQLPTISQ
jgi:hypothetical protein